MPRNFTETANLISGATLNMGGRTIFSNQFPVGEGWRNLKLRFNIVQTIGTGVTPITDGLLQIIRNILFKTDRAEQVINLPGKALYMQNIVEYGIASQQKITVAAATETDTIDVTIPFCDEKMGRPEDTILNTARYSSMTLDLNMGSIADLLTTIGSATATATLDVEVERSRGPLPEEAAPRFYRAFDFRQPVDANTTTSIDLEKSPDLWYKRIYVYSTTGGTSGLPFFGASADTIQNVVQIKDQSSFIQQSRIHGMIRDDVNRRYGIPLSAVPGTASTTPTLKGLEVFDFATDRSTNSALYTGDKSILQYTWTNQGGVGANSIVTAMTEGLRLLK